MVNSASVIKTIFNLTEHKPTYMPSAIKPFKCLPLFFLLFCFKNVNAQEKYHQLTFQIDSFVSAGLPKSALKKVDELDSLAHKNHNAPQQIKAAIYRMTFQSYLEENAIMEIIDRLKKDISKSDYPVKPVLQSLLAQMYWNYYEQNRYRFTQRSTLQKPGEDFTNWDLRTIISETSNLYTSSLAAADKEQHTPLNVLDGVLQGDTATRYLRPWLYDLLVNRAFDFFLADEPALTKPKTPFSLNDPAFFGNSQAFAALNIQTTDTSSTWYKGIRLLQQATAFHLKNNEPEALADLDLRRLKFVYEKSHVNGKEDLYLQSIKHIADGFSAKPISSDALVQISQFYQEKDSLSLAHQYLTKAVNTYPRSIGGKNAATLIKQIEEKQLNAQVEEVNLPNEPLLALLSYKNIKDAKIVLYRLSEKQMKVLYPENENFANNTSDADRYKFIAGLRSLQTMIVDCPATADYRLHKIEFKIDALKPGNYAMIVRDNATGSDSLTSLCTFKVSALAYTDRMTPDDQLDLLITNRKTGKPLNGVKIHVTENNLKYNSVSKKNEWQHVDENGVSGADGYLKLKEVTQGNNLSVMLIFGSDTLNDRMHSVYRNTSYDDDDDEPKDKTVLFTDRQIYRPGQTIYFKGIQLQTLKGKSKLMQGKALEVFLRDQNRKQIASLKLKTNEFGSVAGSFVLPQSMLNGNVSIETSDGDINVSVEEYKRPTFQVAFSPVKTSYKLNDSVTINGEIIAFSGYGLSQVKIAYHVIRSENLYNGGRFIYRKYYNYQPHEIATDTIVSDNQGHFKIKFKAIPGEDEQATYNYNISADATDESGETHFAQTFAVVGVNDIRVEENLPERLLQQDTGKLQVGVLTLNGQLQKAQLNINVFALKNEGKIYKNRLWDKPDQFLFTKADFENNFPFYAYRNEDDPTSWAEDRNVFNKQVQLDGKNPVIINLSQLRKQAAGIYKVVLNVRNERGDTASVIKFVSLLNEDFKPLKTSVWISPVITAVTPGQNADFLVGIGRAVNILVEKYNGANLTWKKWIKVERLQHIKIPVSDTDENVAVQFLMNFENRLYTSYQKIAVEHPNQKLDIKLLSFHNKLLPGQKDEWKLQISGNRSEKQSAELLAGMYDASLDDLTPATNWNNAILLEEKYQQNYFVWNAMISLNSVSTQMINPLYYNYTFLNRNYEQLNLFGYNYYGGYNSAYEQYLRKAQIRLSAAARDKQLADEYAKNAAHIKKGYDITGQVVDAGDKTPIPGVAIKISGTQVSTSTNFAGYFKIKVPINGSLQFSFIGYHAKDYKTSGAENIIIELKGDEKALNEVVVTGYGVQRKVSMLSSAVVKIRGVSNVQDGLYGYVAGVSVAGPARMKADTVEYKASGYPGSSATIATRKNFAETAFFYPQLHTDEKGNILIDFTVPEELTRWKFRAFAHTADLKTGYLESTVVTQKQLSISANTPRFLREGDTIVVSARLANLTDKAIKGKVELKLYNAINMQPVSLLANENDAIQPFDLAAATNKAVSFKLIIPAGLDALTYKLTADAGLYTDGEENTLPVLPNRQLVTESIPMMVRPGQTKTFTFNKLVNPGSTTLKSKTLTLEYTQNPAWYAVQALPYMMEFPYECSEQVFSRYYANSLATNLVNKLPAIKQVFDNWRNASSDEMLSNLSKNQELKETLIEETPWLQDAENETEQKKRIALLFDMNRMSYELNANLDKLQKKQLPDGGFPWFGGTSSDRFITQHIMAGISQLYHLGIADSTERILKTITTRTMAYLDNTLKDDATQQKAGKAYENRTLSPVEIHAYYVKSYFTAKAMNKNLQPLLANYLNLAEKQWTSKSIYEQGMIALTMLRNNKPAVTAAIIKSLKETAQRSDELGMYWANNRAGYFWYQSPVEAQSLMIELFTEAGDKTNAVDEMKIWLLRNKQVSNWKTTKATAAACYALLLKGSDLLSANAATSIKLSGKPLEELKPGLKADAGTGYVKATWADAQIEPALGNVTLTNSGNSISWGALHWQYLENLDKITSAHTNVQLQRKYFIQKQTDNGPVLTEVDGKHQPKTGDLLKVVVYLKADRDFEYVQLKDMRPAGTEPVDVLSTYKYQDGLSYYQVTKDVATNFFISYLNKGNYVFEYSLRVVQPGNFSTGISNLQSMYAPEFNAHSEGGRMLINP